jgi:hypothetical protein
MLPKYELMMRNVEETTIYLVSLDTFSGYFLPDHFSKLDFLKAPYIFLRAPKVWRNCNSARERVVAAERTGKAETQRRTFRETDSETGKNSIFRNAPVNDALTFAGPRNSPFDCN